MAGHKYKISLRSGLFARLQHEHDRRSVDYFSKALSVLFKLTVFALVGFLALQGLIAANDYLGQGSTCNFTFFGEIFCNVTLVFQQWQETVSS